jgi:phage terminase small subunit
MQGRKPAMGTVLPMRSDAAAVAAAAADREREFKRLAKRKAKALMPKGLDDKVRATWLHYAAMLAHPTLDRLKPHYCYGVLQLCKTITLIDGIDEELAKAAKAANTTAIAVRIYRVKGRNGDQVKTHPLVVQRNEAERQLWHWMDEFGLTP